MKVLVGHASRHGSTAGIAERIATTLRESGFEVECRPVGDVDHVASYDAFVVGAAAYMFHWLKDATKFVKRNQTILEDRPCWLFSSGPLGTDLVDEDGRDIFDATRPKEFDDLEALILPVDTQVFFGAWDPDAPPIGLGERVVRMMPAARNSMPSGDFRDWEAIDGWAEKIAFELRERTARQ
jgi:menaquinone-dependent protoporphyrinogen oxidase